MANVSPSFTQSAYRFRFDNGTQTTATWIAAANTNITYDVNTIFRLRFVIQQTLATANTNLTQTFLLRYSANGGAYTNVGLQGTTATPVIFANSANITDAEVTTQQLGAGTFVAGGMDENNAQAVTFTSLAATETEIEYVLQIYQPLMDGGETLDFRVYYATSTALNVYSVTPRLLKTRRSIILG